MTSRSKPLVIALEGLPGSGKTTLKNTLFIEQEGVERIDQILPDDPQDDTLMTLDDIIKSDYLKTQKILETQSTFVLLDRYYQSTLAYQYAYDKLTNAQTYPQLKHTYDMALKTGNLVEPDKTFYINTPLEKSFERKGRSPGDAFWEDPRFLKCIHEYYISHSHFFVIDGSVSISKVKNQIAHTLKEYLPKKSL